MRNSLARRCAAAPLAVVLALGLAACGGGGEEPADGSSPASGTSDPGSTNADTGDEGSGGGGEPDPTVEEYLEVGDGVELTAPGTTLGFGEPAVIAWEPRQDQTAVVEVTVERVDRTSFRESFQGWVITKDMKGQTPLFVRLKVANAGEERIGGEQVPIAVVDDEGIRVQPTVSGEKPFEPCPGGPLPEKFKAGEEVELCLLYLLAPGREFTSVSFQPVDADSSPVAEAVSWTGKLTPIEQEKKGTPRR